MIEDHSVEGFRGKAEALFAASQGQRAAEIDGRGIAGPGAGIGKHLIDGVGHAGGGRERRLATMDEREHHRDPDQQYTERQHETRAHRVRQRGRNGSY